MIKVGAHVSAAGKIQKTFENAQKIEASCFQFFVSPPQQWAQTPHSAENIEEFKNLQRETGIGPNFIHGTYLVNLGTQDPEHLKRGIDWLRYAMSMARELEVRGVIFHLGSHKGFGFEGILSQVVESLKVVLETSEPGNSGEEPYLILENAAGAGNVLGDKFSELGEIIKQVGSPRLKICMDLQHAFGAGYDLKTPEGIEKAMEEFDREIGLSNLVAVHSNDSKVELGANRDRHENIGEGFIGKEGFANIVNSKYFDQIPFLLEVPGLEKTGPDLANVQKLKSLIR